MNKKTLYLSCDCDCLDHVAGFIHYPLSEEDIKDGEKPVIYLNLRMNNYFNKIIPPIRYFYSLYDWQNYFNYNWFKRIAVSFKYILNINYIRKNGILNSFLFQKEDLDKIDTMMALISSDIDDCMSPRIVHSLKNDKRLIEINIEKEIDDDKIINNPYKLGWTPQFKNNQNIFKRISHAFKYIFGLEDEEQEFEICEKDALIIRGMISWLKECYEEENKKIRNKDKWLL